jgi:hypothetical protein
LCHARVLRLQIPMGFMDPSLNSEDWPIHKLHHGAHYRNGHLPRNQRTLSRGWEPPNWAGLRTLVWGILMPPGYGYVP